MHRWAKSPEFLINTGEIHGYWICPCGARESMADFPIPPYGRCTFKWPKLPEHLDRSSNIEALRNLHRGRTIHVLASGKSMDYFSPITFDEYITIGVNEVYREYPVHFVLAHHQECLQEALNYRHPRGSHPFVVTSEYYCGVYAWGRMQLNTVVGLPYYTYKHVDSPHFTEIDLSVMDKPDHLVMSSCTVAEAVHFAYHLGAATIILCGVDGGSIDGKYNYEGYNGGHGTNTDHIRVTLPLLQKVVDEVRRRGTAVYSLNPFMDLGLEGHRFER